MAVWSFGSRILDYGTWDGLLFNPFARRYDTLQNAYVALIQHGIQPEMDHHRSEVVDMQ